MIAKNNRQSWRNKMGFLNHAKTALTGEVRCDWCGKLYKNCDGEGIFGATGGVIGTAIHTVKKNYCSKACKLAAQESKAEKKADFEERKARGELTEFEKLKDEATRPIEEMKEEMKKPFVEMKEETKKQFSEAGQQMKDAVAQPMNDVKKELKNAFGMAFGGMFGKK